MPAPPELGDRAAGIGAVEVFEEPDSEHLAEPDGHVRVAREVEVDLDAEGERPEPCGGEADVPRRRGEHGVGDRGHVVGDDHLLEQAVGEAGNPRGEHVDAGFRIVEVGFDVAIAHDRPGDELGEEGDVCAERRRIAFGADLAAVDVDEVGDALEGEEGDADGQEHAAGDAGDVGARHRVDVVGEEADILEVAEEQEVCADEDGQRRPRRPGLDAAATGEVDDNARQQDPGVVAGAPEIEDEAHHQDERAEAGAGAAAARRRARRAGTGTGSSGLRRPMCDRPGNVARPARSRHQVCLCFPCGEARKRQARRLCCNRATPGKGRSMLSASPPQPPTSSPPGSRTGGRLFSIVLRSRS